MKVIIPLVLAIVLTVSTEVAIFSWLEKRGTKLDSFELYTLTNIIFGAWALIVFALSSYVAN